LALCFWFNHCSCSTGGFLTRFKVVIFMDRTENAFIVAQQKAIGNNDRILRCCANQQTWSIDWLTFKKISAHKLLSRPS